MLLFIKRDQLFRDWTKTRGWATCRFCMEPLLKSIGGAARPGAFLALCRFWLPHRIGVWEGRDGL